MSETIIVVLIVVVGFCVSLWIFLAHIKNLEILLKSKDVVEYTEREILKEAVRPQTYNDSKDHGTEHTAYKDITEVTAEEAFKVR